MTHSQGNRVLGNLKISWKNSFGESGEWMTEPLETTNTDAHGLALLISDIPKKFIIEEPFSLTFELFNKSDRSITPNISFLTQFHRSTMPIGDSILTLPMVPSQQSQLFKLLFLPLKLGLQSLCGIIVHDTLTGSTYEFKTVMHIFVEQKGETVESLMGSTEQNLSEMAILPVSFTDGVPMIGPAQTQDISQVKSDTSLFSTEDEQEREEKIEMSLDEVKTLEPTNNNWVATEEIQSENIDL